MPKSSKGQQDLQLTAGGSVESPTIECLGHRFENDEARRAYFAERLRQKLKDPSFRGQEAFPQGTDDDIVRMSDPPFYTACPNPFLEEFVRCYGRTYDPSERYQRDPFAVDTSVGKTDALYKAHGYHTKVPHLAIVPSILHYTKPGDIVLDGFAGSGMTGVAAQWCGVAPTDYRSRLEMEWKKAGWSKPEWGARRVILSDLAPAATFIAAGNNLPFDLKAFCREAEEILDAVEKELAWMYETRHKDGRIGRIDQTVWSQVSGCPQCGHEVVFTDAAVDMTSGEVKSEFRCPGCRKTLRKSELEPLFETVADRNLRKTVRRTKRIPVAVSYSIGDRSWRKAPDDGDLEIIGRAERLASSAPVPIAMFPFDDMWEAPRLRQKGIDSVHQLFFPRPLHVIARMWAHTMQHSERRMLRFWIESQFANLSLQNRYRPQVTFPYNPLAGVFYISSAISEPDPFVAYRNKLKRIQLAFCNYRPAKTHVCISTGTAARLPLPDACVDYVFTDPPFGDNYPYAELNFVPEAWHGVFSDLRNDAIVDRAKKNRDSQKSIPDYRRLMTGCFAEYFRVTKPGRWITVVFSNSHNAVWRALQEAIGAAGFVVGDVRILDKQTGSFKQVTSSAVKQDLVISAYKPTESLVSKFALGASSEAAAWAFVGEHLRNVPVFVPAGGKGETVAERTAQMLHDRMIAFHVQRGLAVPISGAEFEAGLRERFAEREGMFFLPHQVAEYDRRRTTVTELKQLELFVTDEASAIRWLRQQLEVKPRTLQDLTPEFTRQLQAWERHEVTVELRDLLAQNFVCYDGEGPVPSQIHKYLSSNYKDLRNLSKSDHTLVHRAAGRWYVPDPGQAVDIGRLRQSALLREFQEYVDDPSRRIKLFRTEAVRAGFKAAYDRRDYDLIVRVAQKLPELVLQEDEQLLMYFDVASSRLER